MTRNKGEMGIKKIILTIGMLVAVLAVLALMITLLMEGPLQTYENKDGKCEKQTNEEDCTAITTDAGGQERQKCFWNEETQTCGPRVR